VVQKFVRKNPIFSSVIAAAIVVAAISAFFATQDVYKCEGIKEEFRWNPVNELTSLHERPVRSLYALGNVLAVGFGDGGVALIYGDQGNMVIEYCGGPTQGDKKTVNDFIFYKDSLFVATDQGGIWRLTEGKWRNYGSEDSPSMVFYDLYSSQEDGVLYGASYHGTLKLLLGEDRWVEAANLVAPIAPRRVHAVYQFNGWWLGGLSDGLYHLSEDGQWSHYRGRFTYNWNGSDWETVSSDGVFVPANIRSMDIFVTDEEPALLVGTDAISETETVEALLLISDDGIISTITQDLPGIVRATVYGGESIALNDYLNGSKIFAEGAWHHINAQGSFDNAFYNDELIIATDQGLLRSGFKSVQQ
jgi:hypothetical protein